MATPTEQQSRPRSSYAREMTGLFLFFWAVFLVLCLVTFDKNDPGLNQVSTAAVIVNKAGLFGSYVAAFLNEWFGCCAFLWPVFFVILGLSCISQRLVFNWRIWSGFFLLVLFFLETSEAWEIRVGDFTPGGITGHGLYVFTTHYLHPLGASLLWLFLLMVAVELIFDLSWFALFGSLIEIVKRKVQEKHEVSSRTPASEFLGSEITAEAKPGFRQKLQQVVALFVRSPKREPLPEIYREENSQANPQPADEPLFQPPENLYKDETDDEDLLGLAKKPGPKKAEAKDEPDQAEAKASARQALREVQPEPEPVKPVPATNKASEQREAAKSATSPLNKLQSLLGLAKNKSEAEPKEAPKPRKNHKSDVFPLPPLSLLAEPVRTAQYEKEDSREKAQVLMQALREFAVDGELAAITPGPVVTLFEVRPASGVRVGKFLNISDDMARVLKAPSVRVISPVPGKDTVGIEIPNLKREFVNFRELVATDAFRKAASPLTMALGKDTAGKPVFADLAQMPHMLIAGATGTGKSVCLNSILASFLYRSQPSELKLLLIDPKRVEMSVYADEPHLIHPVVNEPADAKNALEWATSEMDARFKAMARLGARNIIGFNRKLKDLGQNRPDELADLEPLPYIAIIIDELADLMMMADRKDVENCIVRLAQLARACGIHMILATQRPSVNVVTGIIKANFPCRISFQVAGIADSRTILDTAGAEKLLGRGDMLYRPGDTTLKRLHGAFLTDDEVSSIVAHWKSLTEPSYRVNFAQWVPGQEQGSKGSDGSGDDDLFDEVLDFVMQEGVASISKIQRRFRIGFNRAARLVEALDAQGKLDPADGSKPRKVRR